MNVRHVARVAAVGLSLLATGCVYDPYTGTYVPCCTYPAYGYGYPPGYARPPGGGTAAPGRVEPSPGGAYQPQQYQPQSYQPDPSRPAVAGGRAAGRFQQANVTGDGRLTQPQAEAAGWKLVARHFPVIDAGGKGYVTLDDVTAWLASRRQGSAAG